MKTLTYKASMGLKSKNEAYVLEARFGDGYIQRVPGGIQNIQTELSLSFELSLEDTKLLIDFLEEHKGAKAFLWKDPLQEKLEKFICKEWEVEASWWNTRKVNCQFTRMLS